MLTKIPTLTSSTVVTTALPGLATPDMVLSQPERTLRLPSTLRAARRLRLFLRRFLARQAERRLLSSLRRAAARGKSIVVGSIDQPYEPRILDHARSNRSPWEVLRPYAGLDVRLVTRPSKSFADTQVLADLDRRHSVAVDVVIRSLDSIEVEEGLRTVRDLADRGVTTRLALVVEPRAELDEVPLRALFEEAARAGVFDLVAVSRRGQHRSGLIRFWRLRLEFGFPRAVPGQG